MNAMSCQTFVGEPCEALGRQTELQVGIIQLVPLTYLKWMETSHALDFRYF